MMTRKEELCERRTHVEAGGHCRRIGKKWWRLEFNVRGEICDQ